MTKQVCHHIWSYEQHNKIKLTFTTGVIGYTTKECKATVSTKTSFTPDFCTLEQSKQFQIKIHHEREEIEKTEETLNTTNETKL